MSILNVEIKARCPNPEKIRNILQEHNADSRGVDHQVDTYFQVSEGRLKLREDTIENNLIFYRRSDHKEPKTSDIELVSLDDTSEIKVLLTQALGILITVDKHREIYFIDNVKFHIDEVEQLGSFVEIEAIDETGSFGEDKLRDQCEHYMELFNISGEQLVARSYSNLLDE